MGSSRQDKIALVTGGRTGIGLGIAKRFVSDEAQVVITGRRQAELDAEVAEIGPASARMSLKCSTLTRCLNRSKTSSDVAR